MFEFLTRIRTALREGWHDPITHYGAVYEGWYEIKDSRAFGMVKHLGDLANRPPTSVVLARDGLQIGSTNKLEPHRKSWRFEIEIGRPFPADDVLKDRLQVVALDRLGQQSRLKIDGLAQLSYIRDFIGPTSDLELTVDFSRRGNSKEYIRNGWYASEEDHTWTRGKCSTIEIPLKMPSMPYRLEILAWPFVIPGKLDGQQMLLSTGGVQLTRLFAKPGNNWLECEVPEEFTKVASLMVQFDHPNAARPIDFDPTKGDREIALAFRTIKLRRRFANIAIRT